MCDKSNENSFNHLFLLEKIGVLNKLDKEIIIDIKLLYVFRDNNREINVILVTNEDKVYCFGMNSKGVLGFHHNNPVNEFTINENLSDKQIIDLKNSFCHTIARNSDGKLYCWGNNKFIGNGKDDWKISDSELNKYLLNDKIIEMCCASEHTLVLTSNKEVYSWGGNTWGQIGNETGGDGNVVLIPFKINQFNGEKVEAISCGLCHSMALTESGCVYSWGHNGWGQLGLNSANYIENKPKRIQIDVEIKKISCGLGYSLLLSREGDIYVCGWNEDRQLGIETKEMKQLTPTKLNHSEKFTEIAAHYMLEISSALSVNGLYYVWGKFGEEDIQYSINEPLETQFKSFNEIFVNYCGITYEAYFNIS